MALHGYDALVMTEPIPLSIVKQLFPHFETAFGDDYDYVSAVIKPADEPIELTFGSNQTKIVGNIVLSLQNPFNE